MPDLVAFHGGLCSYESSLLILGALAWERNGPARKKCAKRNEYESPNGGCGPWSQQLPRIEQLKLSQQHSVQNKSGVLIQEQSGIRIHSVVDELIADRRICAGDQSGAPAVCGGRSKGA
jgi:hypothetical protein